MEVVAVFVKRHDGISGIYDNSSAVGSETAFIIAATRGHSYPLSCSCTVLFLIFMLLWRLKSMIFFFFLDWLHIGEI